MTPKDFQRIALSLPEAVKSQHFGHADFRVDGKIFATLGLAKEGFGVLLLTSEQQAGMIEDEPKIFSPCSWRIGRQGSARCFSQKIPLLIFWQRRCAPHGAESAKAPAAGPTPKRA